MLNSFDVLGGPSTFNVVWASAAFASANPRVLAAFAAALDEALASIAADPRSRRAPMCASPATAATSASSPSILSHPQVSFTATPQAIGKVVDFMARTGTIRRRPGDWKDLFFAGVHDKAGS